MVFAFLILYFLYFGLYIIEVDSQAHDLGALVRFQLYLPLTLDIAVAKKQEDIRFVRRVSTANDYIICDPRPWDYEVTVPADTSSGGAQEYRDKSKRPLQHLLARRGRNLW